MQPTLQAVPELPISKLAESAHLLALRVDTLSRAAKNVLDDIGLPGSDRLVSTDAFILLDLIREASVEIAQLNNEIEVRS